jgi:(1->4)-alpha-D-glucan 1-alpha-D-glucosylmutase
LLKLTCPGVPDIYQGTEVWDLSMVDPDNRRLVDYGRRWGLLEWLRPVLESQQPGELQPLLSELMENRTDGRIKQFLIAKVMRFRGEHRELFQQGGYVPLEVSGSGADHVVAFARVWEEQVMITVAPRLCYSLAPRRGHSIWGKRTWRDTIIHLPQELASMQFYNLFSHEAVPHKNRHPAEIEVAEIMKDLPFGVLVRSH